MITYCKRCILPSSRPNLVIREDGVCTGCLSHANRPTIDWEKRKKAFLKEVQDAKNRHATYDCLIPVSGGKDSTWQVVICLEHGLRPLALTWKTPARTVLGRENLQNLIDLGVDHVDFQVNPKVEKKFLLQALKRYGSTAIPMHMAMFNLPLVFALKWDIPLIVWGENSATEYGGTDDDQHRFRLDSQWLKKYGVTHGTTAADWVSDQLTQEEMTPYRGPTPEALDAKGIQAIFLGQFFPWDPETSLSVAQKHGFKVRQEGPKTGYYNYADIDDDFISIHHFFKWYKFGFTRTYDNLSLEIRNGRMTRAQAIELIRSRGMEIPHEDIEKFCAFVGITQKTFFEIAETFRNRDLWVQEKGRWVIPGFLIPDWEWK